MVLPARAYPENPGLFVSMHGSAQKVDEGVATEGHPYKTKRELAECRYFVGAALRGRPTLEHFCAKPRCMLLVCRRW